MSDTSINYSNESPAGTPPGSPIIPNSSLAAATLPNLPLSPRSAANALAHIPNLSAELQALANGLILTIQSCDALHSLEKKGLANVQKKLEDKVNSLEDELQKYHDDPICPDGFQDNNKRVDTAIPVGAGFSMPAKWVRQCEDRRVELLTGEDHDELPFVTELYAQPSYDIEGPVEAMPSWFFQLLNGPNPAFHTLREAVVKLDNWNEFAEIQRFRYLDDEQRQLNKRLSQVRAELDLVEERLQSSRHRIEAAHIPDKVGHLEGRAYPRCQLGRRSVRRNFHPYQHKSAEPGVSA